MKTLHLTGGIFLLVGLLSCTALAQMGPGYDAPPMQASAYNPYFNQAAPGDSPGVVPVAQQRVTSRRGSSELWTLPQPQFLEGRGIKIGGWIDQGISVVANNPANRFNGPVTFNDRDAEWMFNQISIFAEKKVDTGGYGWDVGGRIDFMFGTDGRFTQARGLETRGDGTPKWNAERFYHAALPQFYLDVGFNDWTVRMGHFYTIIGYEVVGAPDNFFYSHAYTMQYGEPFTHTGILLMRDVGPFSVTAGLHRGNDQFEDADGVDALNFLGGVNWTGPDDNLSIAFALSASEDGPGINTTIYSIVGTLKLTENLTYVLQHDLGVTDGPVDAEWYGLNQYLLYDINRTWGAGMRFEWFRDDDGARTPAAVAGDYYELTAGLNWKPHANIRVRPEVRWDWFEGPGFPYDAGGRDNQFLLGCDLICTY